MAREQSINKRQRRGTGRWGEAAPLILLLVIYLAFSIADLQSSAQTSNRGADRSLAHMALLLLTGYLTVYLVFQAKKIASFRIVQPLGGLCVLAVWVLISCLYNQVSTWDLLVRENMSVLWVLSYVSFFCYASGSSRRKLNLHRFSLILLLFFAAATVYYFAYITIVLKHVPVLNVVYNVLALLPWVMVGLRGRKRMLLYLLCGVIAVLSMKRGAIVALPLMYVVDVAVNNKNGKKGELVRKIGGLLAAIVAFCVLFLLFDNATGGFLSSRFSASEIASGSGRSDQYTLAFAALSERNLLELIMGSGVGSSVDLIGTGIHNEWIEILYSYGLVGLAIYASMVFGLIRRAGHLSRCVPDCKPSCWMMVALILVISLISSAYGAYVGFFLFGFWGFVEAAAGQKGLD